MGCDFTSDALHDELLHWGHDCMIHVAPDRFRAWCFSWCNRPPLLYVYHQSPPDEHYVPILHPAESLMTVIDHMQLLYRFGFNRAVIMDNVPNHDASIIDVHFVNNRPELEDPIKPMKLQTPWPEPQPQVPMTPYHHLPESRPRIDNNDHDVRLQTGLGRDDWLKLFQSGQNALCTIVDLPDLPEIVKEALQSCTTITRIDRLVIYTDGSSRPHLRRRPVALIDDQGLNDTWSFVVLAEQYIENGASELQFVGWQTQPVLYDTACGHCLGSGHAGSDLAEAEALIWAGMWRLSQNSNVPTVFRSDSVNSCQTATGHMNSHTGETTMLTLRRVYQALEQILPEESLKVQHVKGHAGDVWNELADHIARSEAQKSFHLPRQSLDMKVWPASMVLASTTTAAA
eukprot:Skav209013  [mRNA]  locus=scaffold2833:122048:123247:- [translate_table: standard]